MPYRLSEVEFLSNVNCMEQSELISNHFDKVRDGLRKIRNLSEGYKVSNVSYDGHTKDSLDMVVTYNDSMPTIGDIIDLNAYKLENNSVRYRSIKDERKEIMSNL